MVINQGDIYWVSPQTLTGLKDGYSHPHVIIQENTLNHSRVSTVVVCALTTNQRRAKAPGNVLLELGEANLSRRSIVIASKVSTIKKAQLGDYIGSLSQERIDQIVAGMRFVQWIRERHDAKCVNSETSQD